LIGGRLRRGLGGWRSLLDPVTRGWAVVTAASVGRLVLGFVASVLVARILGPAQYGLFSILGRVSAVAALVVDGGLTNAAVDRMASVVRADRPALARRAVNFFWVRMAAAAVGVSVGIALASPLARIVFGPDANASLFALNLVGVLATASSGSLSAILQAIGQFGRLGAVLISNSALTAVLAVLLATAHALDLFTAVGVLGVGTSIASFAVALWLLPRDLRPGRASRQELAGEGRALFGVSRWLWLAHLFGMLAAQADVLMVNWWAGLDVAGPYALAVNLAAKAEVINQSLTTVVLPAASSLRGQSAVSTYIKRGLIRSGLISLVLLVLIPMAGPLIQLAYGGAFLGSIGLFQGLLGVAIFDICAMPLLLLAFPAGRFRLLAIADAARLITLVVSASWMIPLLGAQGAVLARLASRVLGAGLVLLALRRPTPASS
jgi:O-antigen/teichoic acid export membrane protein